MHSNYASASKQFKRKVISILISLFSFHLEIFIFNWKCQSYFQLKIKFFLFFFIVLLSPFNLKTLTFKNLCNSLYHVRPRFSKVLSSIVLELLSSFKFLHIFFHLLPQHSVRSRSFFVNFPIKFLCMNYSSEYFILASILNFIFNPQFYIPSLAN